MPNKDFEKQVKRKMDELHFIPSDLVWEKVEQQIGGHKKRRRILVWLPLLLLLITAATWMYKSNIKSGKQQAQTAEPGTTTSQTEKYTPVTPDKLTGTHSKDSEKENSKTGKNALHLDPANVTELDRTLAKRAGRPVNSKMDANTHFSRQFHVYKETTKPNANQEKSTSKEKNNKTIQEAIDETSVAAEDTENDKKVTIAAKTTDPAIAVTTDSTAKQTVVAKNENKTDSTVVTALKEPVAKKKKDKDIEWGITADAGISGVSQGFSGFLRSSPASAIAYYYTSTPSNTPVAVVSQPSEIRPGAAYSVGVSGRKKYSKTFSLFAGINYSYYSTRINVGEKRDSAAFINQGSLGLQSVNSFYRTDNINSHSYINRYHFVELPLGIEKQMGNGSPFSLNAGITVSQLISSNVLHYDGQKGIYYQDNKLINKTQLGFFGGIAYRLLQKNTSMEIGPQFQYGLTNLYKKELYGNRHLIFVAVSARIFFHKNKR